jgi:hypothetical protein
MGEWGNLPKKNRKSQDEDEDRGDF